MSSQFPVEYEQFLIDRVLTPFYEKRLAALRQLSLGHLLSRKNPYLFKAKNIETTGELVRSVVDAFLSSQEETVFGNLLEEFAIFVSARVDGGFKSSFRSVDLEFRRDGVYYLVGIKSGTNWGNADQINAMKSNFKAARLALRERGITDPIAAVNGCMYGTEAHVLKDKRKVSRGEWEVEDPDKVYYKYAGQDFWAFVSGDEMFYQHIISPIDQEARLRDDTFKSAYAAKINQLSEEFSHQFLTPQKHIDWQKLIDVVSRRRTDG